MPPSPEYAPGATTIAKAPSFNFGANAKPKKAMKGGGKTKAGKKGGKGNAWTAYAGGGRPFTIPA